MGGRWIKTVTESSGERREQHAATKQEVWQR